MSRITRISYMARGLFYWSLFEKVERFYRRHLTSHFDVLLVLLIGIKILPPLESKEIQKNYHCFFKLLPLELKKIQKNYRRILFTFESKEIQKCISFIFSEFKFTFIFISGSPHLFISASLKGRVQENKANYDTMRRSMNTKTLQSNVQSKEKVTPEHVTTICLG